MASKYRQEKLSLTELTEDTEFLSEPIARLPLFALQKVKAASLQEALSYFRPADLPDSNTIRVSKLQVAKWESSRRAGQPVDQISPLRKSDQISELSVCLSEAGERFDLPCANCP